MGLSQVLYNNIGVIVGLHEEVVIVETVIIGVDEGLSRLLPEFISALYIHHAFKVMQKDGSVTSQSN